MVLAEESNELMAYAGGLTFPSFSAVTSAKPLLFLGLNFRTKPNWFKSRIFNINSMRKSKFFNPSRCKNLKRGIDNGKVFLTTLAVNMALVRPVFLNALSRVAGYFCSELILFLKMVL